VAEAVVRGRGLGGGGREERGERRDINTNFSYRMMDGTVGIKIRNREGGCKGDQPKGIGRTVTITE